MCRQKTTAKQGKKVPRVTSAQARAPAPGQRGRDLALDPAEHKIGRLQFFTLKVGQPS